MNFDIPDSRAQETTVMIVPTFNERENIPELVRRFFLQLEEAHLLVVDDNSPDDTASVCEGLIQQYPNLHILRREGRRGLGPAYLAGMAWALEHNFEIIGTMDADLSHDPAHLPRMFSVLKDNDIVIGSRYIRDGGTINWKIRRVLLSWLANKYAAKLLGIPAHDLTSGFRLYRRKVLGNLQLERVKSTGYSFLAELLYRAHKSQASIAESPIIFFDRKLGVSKLQSKEIYWGAFNLLRLRCSKDLFQ
ncbi:MAG: polyprenol monophosphomannose synthase [Acidobacteria bacterium]|nr:MAG: polyprenol monophosphomannose synthase [Acidobacteriota bacterium]